MPSPVAERRLPHPLAANRIRDIQPYQPGTPIEVIARQRGLDPRKIIKLASNENLAGPAPNAIAALQDAAEEANYYPECSGREIAEELGDQLEVEPGRIKLANSSNEGINYVCRAFLNPGEELVMSAISFPMYPIGAQYQDGKVVRVPNDGWSHDVDGILGAITDRTKLVFLDIPINPTGTMLTQDQINYYFSKVPGHVLTVLDTAYDGFVESPHYPDALELQNRCQAIVLRTFSKLYGLADLRFGFIVADPQIVAALSHVHPPFYLPRHHQAAVLAALKHDGDFVQQTIKTNRQGKVYLYRELDRMGVQYVPTEANYIFYPCKDPAQVYDRFLDDGIIIRPIGNIGVRVSIGLPEHNAAFIHSLDAVHRAGLM